MSNQIEHQLAHPESSLATRRSSLTAIATAHSRCSSVKPMPSSTVAADDGLIVAASEHRLDEPELAQAALKRVELVLADPARVGRIWVEVVDRDLINGEGGERGSGHAVRALRVLSAMRTSVR